jgi:hypothetical protein
MDPGEAGSRRRAVWWCAIIFCLTFWAGVIAYLVHVLN